MGALVVVVVVATLLLPFLDAHVGLAGASLADRTSGGRRPAVWALFLDAVSVHPWVGWGVLQNGVAQYALATAPPLDGLVVLECPRHRAST